MERASLQHWEQYYRGGALATCPTSNDLSYDKELRTCWEDFFRDLQDDARILDVGTGNGAVALIARELAGQCGRNWEIHGSDLAQIDPVRDVPGGAERLAGIKFHSGVATERLPFDDASVDAVSGHYALEYMDRPAALREIRRVLRPDGRAQFVIHHAASRLLVNAAASLDEAEIVKESRVYRRLRRLMLVDADKLELLQRRQEELQLAIRMLKRAAAERGQGGHISFVVMTLNTVRKLLELRRERSSAAVELEILRVEGEFRNARKRLNDLIAHALDATELEALQQQALTVGFTHAEHQELRHDGEHLVGWLLQLR